MSGDVLSQAEVESLLSALDTGKAAGGAGGIAPTATAKRGGGGSGTARMREKVTTYDFKRPERVGKDQMRALQTLHEGFGRNFGAALSGFLRGIIEVKLTSVDQLTYSEFIFSLENPTCFNLLKAEPLEGNLILDINPSILYPIIDRLLGGGKESGPLSRRPLTEIERRLVGRITGLFLEELRGAWANVLEIQFEVVRMETNPQLIQIVPPNEVVVLISFELTLGDVRGMMNLCIPYNSIERISSKLAANSWISYGRNAASQQTIKQLSSQLRGALVELVVQLADTTINAQELITLRVGDVITTEHDVKQPLVAAVEGTPKFFVKAGALKGRKAVQVDQPISDPPAALAVKRA